MRVRLGKYIWLPKSAMSESDAFLIKKDLTIVPQKQSFTPKKKKSESIEDYQLRQEKSDEVRPICMYSETSTELGVPMFYYLGKKRGDHEEIDELSWGTPLPENTHHIRLRPDDQLPLMEEVYNKIANNGRQYGGGLLDAYTGFGKSICAVWLMQKLGGNTILLVHSEPLMEKWIEDFSEIFPNAKVGMIQADKCDYQGKDICVGMIQTLMRDGAESKFPPEFWTYFRTLMVDEVHRMGSEHFGKAAPKFSARYRFGMSGTIRRTDKCEDVFKWVLGPILGKAKETNRQIPQVYVRETGFHAVVKETSKYDSDTGGYVDDKFDMNNFPKPILLNFIAKDQNRNKLIAYDICRALLQGRNPLVMSERKEMLEQIAKFVDWYVSRDDRLNDITHGWYIGGKSKKTRKQELKSASQCSIVYSTIQLAKEGVNIPRLDTLFMASPLADVEQLVGRVCRPMIKYNENGDPYVVERPKRIMVVDYRDSELKHLNGLFYSRYRQYKSLGWEMIGLKYK